MLVSYLKLNLINYIIITFISIVIIIIVIVIIIVTNKPLNFNNYI